MVCGTAIANHLTAFTDGASEYVMKESSRVYTRDGGIVDFPELHQAAIFAIATDQDGNIYVGGAPHHQGHINLRKYDKDGALIWSVAGLGRATWFNDKYSYRHDIIENIIIGSDGALYVAGRMLLMEYPYQVYPNTKTGPLYWFFKKISPEGEVIWTQVDEYCIAITSIDEDSSGRLIAGIYRYEYSNGVTTHSNIAEINKTTGQYVRLGLIADGSGYASRIRCDGNSVYAQLRKIITVEGPNVCKLNAETWGAEGAWRMSYFPPATASLPRESFLSFDVKDGVCYFGRRSSEINESWIPTGGGSGYVETERNYFHFVALDTSSGNYRWTSKTATGRPGIKITGEARDYSSPSEQYLYAPYAYSSIDGLFIGPDAYKNISYSGTSNPLDIENNFSYSLDSVYEQSFDGEWSRAGVVIIDDDSVPSLAIHLENAKYSTIGDGYTISAAIPLYLGIDLPVFRREYAGALYLPDVYRLSIAGDLWLSIRSLTIRRSVGLDALTIVAAMASPEQVAEVRARVGESMTLWRGVRFLDGQEQLEPMLTVPLESMRYDRGPGSGSFTLSGSTSAGVPINRPRTLRGVSYLQSTNGARRLRCAIDTYLAPGDTALIRGSSSMLVNEILISISPTSGVMEVAE